MTIKISFSHGRVSPNLALMMGAQTGYSCVRWVYIRITQEELYV